MHKADRAAYAAVEVLIWQLVTSGTLRAAPLASELDRYAGFSGDAAPLLRVLAEDARAAARPAPEIPAQQPDQSVSDAVPWVPRRDRKLAR